MRASNTTTTVSAPGKALVAGGYLVLERPNPGIVIATDSCFHASISAKSTCDAKTDQLTTDSLGTKSMPLDVYSPQFHITYRYWVDMPNNIDDLHDKDVLLKLRPRNPNQQSNSFIEKSIVLTLSFILIHLSKRSTNRIVDIFPFMNANNDETEERIALAIKLQADNDFYSPVPHLQQRGEPFLPRNVMNLPPYLACPTTSSTIRDGASQNERVVVKIHKTGLGSSAALVTSLVGALLQHFNVVSCPSVSNDSGHNIGMLHNLAQLGHSLAQGKIGSGFDVSAAVWGSHIYTRFDPQLLQPIMDSITGEWIESMNKKDVASQTHLTLSVATSEKIWNCVTERDIKWDSEVQPFYLPENLELLMADVCGGSESPSMAKRVLKWKNDTIFRDTKEHSWTELIRVNEKIKGLFLQKDAPTIVSYKSSNRSSDDGCSESVASIWLQSLRESVLESRKYLKQMGNDADVPIEPDIQTSIADATMGLPGVIAAGVPGAGGYDALFVLYVKGKETKFENGKKSDETRERIGQMWIDWCGKGQKKNVVCPLSCKSVGFGGLYGVHSSQIQW